MRFQILLLLPALTAPGLLAAPVTKNNGKLLPLPCCSINSPQLANTTLVVEKANNIAERQPHAVSSASNKRDDADADTAYFNCSKRDGAGAADIATSKRDDADADAAYLNCSK